MRSVLITGGARGIGRCAAAEFGRHGYRLLLTDVDPAALEQARDELSSLAEVHLWRVDVTDAAQVEQLAGEVVARFGPPEVLVNNAGIGFHGELSETSLANWRRLFEVDLLGAVHHVNAFLPAMAKAGRGTIVNVSSGQAFIQMPTWGAYAAVKAALAVYSEVLYFELRGAGIHVATVYPFMVNTGFYGAITGESFGHRLAMRLLPWYSMSPEQVGRRIYAAAARRRRIDLTHPVNMAAYYGRLVPGVALAMGLVSHLLMTGSATAEAARLKGGLLTVIQGGRAHVQAAG